MGQGGGFQVGVNRLDDGVAAVGLVGGDGVEVCGGEEGVETPYVEQCGLPVGGGVEVGDAAHHQPAWGLLADFLGAERGESDLGRSEEHTSELQSLMRTSYSVICLKKKSNTPESMLR